MLLCAPPQHHLSDTRDLLSTNSQGVSYAQYVVPNCRHFAGGNDPRCFSCHYAGSRGRTAAEAVAAHATSRPSIAAAAPMSNMPGMGMAAVEDITGVQPRGR